jgi:hypothetical protein
MPEQIATINVRVFDDGTTQHTATFLKDGNAVHTVGSEDVEPPSYDALVDHYGEHAPKDHPMSPDFNAGVSPDDIAALEAKSATLRAELAENDAKIEEAQAAVQAQAEAEAAAKAAAKVEPEGDKGDEAEPLKGKLPADFPHLDVLHKHEPLINTYGQLAKYADDYTKIKGIGPSGAQDIIDALAAPPKVEEAGDDEPKKEPEPPTVN